MSSTQPQSRQYQLKVGFTRTGVAQYTAEGWAVHNLDTRTQLVVGRTWWLVVVRWSVAARCLLNNCGVLQEALQDEHKLEIFAA